jgi:hypothetical protein
MELIDKKNWVLSLYEKYPKKQGNKNLKLTEEFSEGYDRYRLISNELKNIDLYVSHKNERVMGLYEMLKGDSSDLFFTRGIIEYKWNIFLAFKLFKSGLYHKDYDRRIIIDKVNSGEVQDLKFIYKTLNKNYNNIQGYLYVLGIKDNDLQFNYKKIGVTSGDYNYRIKVFNTSVPFVIYPNVIWEIPNGMQFNYEKYFHKKFKDINKKSEWFIDKNNEIISHMKKDKKLYKLKRVDF